MAKLSVFNNVTLDGYFVDHAGDMRWAHAQPDAEWNEFVSGNASGEGVLVFGRITYEMMAGYWPSPHALQNNPVVAEGMNKRSKIVFSRTLSTAEWNNTTLIKGNLAQEVRRLKSESDQDMVILGSGSIVAQLATEGLIDQYQFVINPLALGRGRTPFEGMTRTLSLKLIKSRAFANGNVVLWYEDPNCAG